MGSEAAIIRGGVLSQIFSVTTCKKVSQNQKNQLQNRGVMSHDMSQKVL